MEQRGQIDRPIRTLLVTTNGTGMGHLARMSAVALAGSRASAISPHIFTLSVAAPLAATLGIPVEYCPSTQRRWLPYWRWDAYLRARLGAFIRAFDIEIVVFDGVMPYDGLVAAMADFPAVAFAWCRRGLWRAEAHVARRALARERFFDAVIEPGDFAERADTGPTAGRADIRRTQPVSLLSETDLLPRVQARASLHLRQDGKYVLFAFGSGLAGESAAVLRELVDAAGQQGWRVAALRPWGDTRYPDGVDMIERVFPLVTYAQAFDAVVTSAGYNTVHEFIAAGLPTLVSPNAAAATDDQESRAAELAACGLALTAPSAGEPLRSGIRELLDGWQMRVPPPPHDGATGIALMLEGLAAQPRRRKVSTAIRVKLAIMRMAGPTLVSAARRMRGRASAAIKIRELRITSDLQDAARYDDSTVIEHVLEGATAATQNPDSWDAYAAARREIAREYYPSRL